MPPAIAFFEVQPYAAAHPIAHLHSTRRASRGIYVVTQSNRVFPLRLNFCPCHRSRRASLHLSNAVIYIR